jgi:D-amino peptidase
MEGISGVVYWPQPQTGGRDARDDERQRKAMAGDVNAVVEGARRGGGTEFHVLDFHGSSPSRPNLLPDDMDPDIRLISGQGHMSMTRLVHDAGYDAMALVGMHAYDGVQDGVLSHNFTSTYKEIYVNELRIGEIGFFALLAGAHQLPLVLVTGDEAACREARDLLGEVETVATKRGLGHGLALLYPLRDVRKALQEAAERAIAELPRFHPLNTVGPYRVEIVMGGGRETRKADVCCMFPFVERVEESRIGYTCEDLGDALANLRALHLLAETQRPR